MHNRTIVHSCGDRFRWQLAVCGRDVTASRHLTHGDGSIYFTTATFDLDGCELGGDELTSREVVTAYCEHSQCGPTVDQLVALVESEYRRTAAAQTNGVPA